METLDIQKELQGLIRLQRHKKALLESQVLGQAPSRGDLDIEAVDKDFLKAFEHLKSSQNIKTLQGLPRIYYPLLRDLKALVIENDQKQRALEEHKLRERRPTKGQINAYKKF